MSLKQIKGQKSKKKIAPSINPINYPPSLTQRYQSFIFKMKLKSITPFVSLIKHYEIREDFLQIYSAHVKEMYRNPRLIKPSSISKHKWGKRISDVRDESLRIDPHSVVKNMLEYALNKYRWIKELLTHFLEIVMIILFLIVVVSGWVFLPQINLLPLFEEYQKYVTYLIILPIILVVSLFSLYRYILAYDTELFHLVNSKLAYTRRDVYLHQRYPRYNNSDIIAMVIWNHSLMNYTNYTVVFSMLCIKMVSKNLIYRYLFKALKEITPKYLEEFSKTPRDTMKIRRAMYEEWRFEFKEWWNKARSNPE